MIPPKKTADKQYIRFADSNNLNYLKNMKNMNFNFDRQSVRTGILHFGVGNFHRAHMQWYTNELLGVDKNLDWGICGAKLMPSDMTLYNKLKTQDGVYSLTVCKPTGENSVQWIGSLTELMWSGEDIECIIEKVANSGTKIVSMTITEGGYNIDTESAQQDLQNPQHPTSIFGIVAEGLRRRIQRGNGGITILSCDNLQHNGDTCRGVFMDFFERQDPAVAVWASDNVTFPNSMVDRITPATTPADVERLNEGLDCRDEVPVYCEDFIQWVVEDNFAAGRPAWERVGVEFTDDVVPFENMKLSLLNASHTMLSYPSVLAGYRKVDVAMGDPAIVSFVRDFMDIDVTPFVPAPKNTDLGEYKRRLVERFSNSAVSDQIQRLCGDGGSKFGVYVLPIAQQMLTGGKDMTRIAYLLAAYRHYLKYRMDDNGESFEVFEPTLIDADYQKIDSENPQDFLHTSPFVEARLDSHPEFVAQYTEMTERIKTNGAMATLSSII